MNTTLSETISNTCLDSVRTAIGRERFDHGTHDQTLRPASTTVLNPSSDEAALPQTLEEEHSSQR